MKCNKCGNEMRIAPEQVGVDSSNMPIYHRFAYCDNCKIKADIDIVSQPQDYKNQTPPNNAEAKKEKSHSALSVWALVLSLFGCTSFIAFILALVDLCQNDKNKKHIGSWFALIVCALYILVVFSGAISSSDNKADNNAAKTSVQNSVEQTQEVEIEYITVTVDELTNTLESNALKAETQYQDAYLEVTGKLNVIDSDGKYISLTSINDEWDFTGIRCDIMNDDQKAQVLEMNVGDEVTLRGQVTDIGEILGYNLEISEIME